MPSDLVITISGDRRRLRSELDKTEKDLGRFSTSTKARMKAVGLAAAGAAASFGTAGLAFGIKKAVDEWRDADKVARQTEAVIKSTGGAANVTAGQLSRLAERLSLVAGVDDEVIQRGANMLLTFKNIRNEVGRNNDIFNQTVRATLDMAAAMAAANNSEINLRTASIQVGKALNDPIKGVTALSRVGVQFSDSQRAVIERLVESGNKMGAQKLILRELRSEFAGSAKANADSMDRIGVAIDNIFEKFGKKLAPIVTEVATKMARFVIQMNNGRGAGGKFVRTIEDIWKVIKTAINVLVAWNRILLRIPKLWIDIGAAGVKAAKAIVSAIRSAFNTVKKAAGDAIAFVLRRFADLVDVASKIPIIGDKFENLADDIRGAANRVDQLGENIKRVPRRLQVDVMLKAAQSGEFDLLVPPSQLFGKGGSKAIRGALVKQAMKSARSNLARVGPLPLFQGLGTQDVPGGLQLGGAQHPFHALAQRFGLQVGSGYRPWDTDSWHGVGRARDYPGAPDSMMAFAQFMARTFGSRLLELIYTPLGFSIDNGRRVAPFAQADHYDHVHVAMQRGGTIPGSGSGDKVPVLAEPGEGFINKRAVAAMGGRRVIDFINKMVPRFAEGGVVSAFNRAINRSGASGTKAELALWMAGIVESGLRNLSYGDADSTGALQVRAGTAAGLGIDPMNPGQVAMAFLTRGFWGKGGAISLARNRNLTAGNVAQMVQGSAFPDRYDAVRTQAMKYMGRDRRNRGRDGGGGGGGGGGRPDRPEDRDPTRPGAQRLTPAERRARTPVRGATTGGLAETIMLSEQRLERVTGDTGIAAGPREQQAILQHGFNLGERQRRIGERLRTINRALRGRLRPATRQRLLQERASLLQERGTIRMERRELSQRYFFRPEPEAGEAGGVSEDPNQPLIDAMNQHAEAVKALTDQQKALQDEVKRQNDINQSTIAIGLREAQRAFADVISGQIAGIAGQRARSAGSGLVGATY